MSHRIHIFHTNDWHSHLAYWPRFQAYYQREKARLTHVGEDVLFFDLGDCMDRFEPWTEAERGKNMVQLLNEVPADAATIGNNEGIGLSHEELTHLYDEATFPVVLSNVYDKRTHKRADFAEKYHVLTLPSGVRVAIFGLTAIYSLSYNVLNWDQTDIDATIEEVLAAIQQEAHPDMILFLSHLGIHQDERLAAAFPSIDVIFGAHTHHVLEHGEWVGETLLTGGGKFGTYLGHLTIDYDQFKSGATTRAMTERLLPLEELPAVLDEEEIVEGWHKKGHEALSRNIVGRIAQALPTDEAKINPIQRYTVQAVKEGTQADIVLLHSGLFLKSLSRGNVTEAMLHECLPHPMRLIQLQLSGRALLDELRPEIEALHDTLQYKQIVGMGFRGNIFGELLSSDPLTEETIDPKRTYRVVTVDHLTFLPFFEILHQTEGELWGEPFLREVLGSYIKKHTGGEQYVH